MEQKLRFAQKEEAKQIVEWLEGKPGYDAAVLDYPTLKVLCSYNDVPKAYVPFQTVAMMESTANNPEANEGEVAQAFRDCVKAIGLLASAAGMRELYFLATDEATAKMAEKRGFERMPWPALRMKLK